MTQFPSEGPRNFTKQLNTDIFKLCRGSTLAAAAAAVVVLVLAAYLNYGAVAVV